MKIFKKLALLSVFAAPLASFAVGPDLTSLTSQIDVTTVIAAVLATGAALVLLQLAIKGAFVVLGMFRGGR